ncbi:bifunctional DNA-formamidopyrimidine glycosylase/DNA-(apurinic or apyrimidinic site) lyase [Microbacterium sp. C7(2022)]|uniref:bifunctional DNA-formamidopyrimidine glycosylase/DNA-(apurinic or apyrimidinic site) lyase n=1 Tax=Microbacterium sp. C7(2022) TaxID=2992759 RepID=UPI00237B2964|nr:bifunctional DNA-formamidopyrimidine glycosylase/DNA-(apurinic or apyrimidinic site) lyase [Microbacterium sp. C7(2022)]MDE0546880.1 bifunctional DNA-formamidopyrimidine glycosylase/DNA-(apurinic or apyrimidinic site) lyase [Microbacterium sp. C7(2022)]
MPELPEVEVVRAGLAPAVTEATVTAVSVWDVRALTRHSGDTQSFEGAVTGRRITAAVRRGKFLWFPLSPPGASSPPTEAVVAHLGMSGQMLLRVPGAERERHERVRIDLHHPLHGELVVVFSDQRTFGSLAVDALLPTVEGAPGGFGDESPVVPGQVAHIARDPLDPAFSDQGFRDGLRGRAVSIKRALLDQTRISGVGNIYADEALWAARIHPDTVARDLSTRRVSRLLSEIRGVLHKALAEGGTSFDAQYVNVNGQAGYFAHSLNAYGRTGQPCPRCGRAIVRVAFTNRSSHYCPRCQKL